MEGFNGLEGFLVFTGSGTSDRQICCLSTVPVFVWVLLIELFTAAGPVVKTACAVLGSIRSCCAVASKVSVILS